jgi:hypothetical protein
MAFCFSVEMSNYNHNFKNVMYSVYSEKYLGEASYNGV